MCASLVPHPCIVVETSPCNRVMDGFSTEAISSVLRNFFVDDYLKSIENEKEAVENVHDHGSILAFNHAFAYA